MPQILESEDSALVARAYSLLVDADMGVAGELWSRHGRDSTLARNEYINRALGYLDSAYDAYEEIEDFLGQTEMMAKKATLMHRAKLHALRPIKSCGSERMGCVVAAGRCRAGFSSSMDCHLV